jgi:hypothetical protein
VLNTLVVTVILSQNFKNTSDFIAYFFAAAGFLIVLKTFIATYANLAYSIQNKRWYVLVANILLMSFQLTCFFLALIWFKNDTYPQAVAGYYLAATFGLVAQLVLGMLTSSIRYQLFSLIYYAGILGLLHTRAFNADLRFLQVIAVLSFGFELILVLNLYRSFQFNEVITITPKSPKSSRIVMPITTEKAENPIS